jgi:Cys-rich protein (TIGR01571 family)
MSEGYPQPPNSNPYPAQPLPYNNYAGSELPYPSPERQPSSNFQQPHTTYQQQPQGPVVMSYNQPQSGMDSGSSVPQAAFTEKGAPPPQGYQPGPPPNQAQPMPQSGMNPKGPGGPAGAQYDANGERDWSNGLLDCFGDCGTCCLAYFCPCLVYQQVKNRITYLNLNGRPDPQRGGSGFGGDCILWGALTGCCGLGWVLQMSTRATLRTRYRIRGGGCTDCLAAGCCMPCELTQESRELDVEEGYLR